MYSKNLYSQASPNGYVLFLFASPFFPTLWPYTTPPTIPRGINGRQGGGKNQGDGHGEVGQQVTDGPPFRQFGVGGFNPSAKYESISHTIHGTNGIYFPTFTIEINQMYRSIYQSRGWYGIGSFPTWILRVTFLTATFPPKIAE